jgi:hypothetical protein
MADLAKPGGVIIGAILVFIGSFLTWVTVDVGFAEFSSTGTETTDGKLTAVAAGVMILAGLALLVRGVIRTTGLYVGLVAAVFAAVVLINDYMDVRERIANTPGDQASATVGIGVWVTGIGCLVALGVLAWAIRDALRNREVAV